MKLGIFSVMDFHPEQQHSAAGFYRKMIDLAVQAEKLGYDSAWVAEHHFANYGLCPAPPVLLAAIAQMAVPYILEDLSVLKDLLAGYTAQAAASHRAHSGPRVTVAFHIHVASTQAEAEARARAYMTRYCETRAVGNTKTFDQLMRRRLIAVGDPEHVTAILQQLASFGVEQVLCLMNFGGMPFRMVLEPLTLTAQEVMPRLAA
jgi:alkanesulfonate monooxygenase SsuD/methylene tetrahydromethanopterin reductase-like flavin-dependent oxidoreductase (luciferase family)